MATVVKGQARVVAPTAARPSQAGLPPGAVKWSRTYVGRDGKPEAAFVEVPVDADDRRTAHVRHTCRGLIEVDGVKQPCDQVAWLDGSEGARYCPDHGARLEPTEKVRAPGWLPWRAVWLAVRLEVRPAYGVAAALAVGVVLDRQDVPAWAVLAATPALAAAGHGAVWQFLTARVRRRARRGGVAAEPVTGRLRGTYLARARLGAYTGVAGGGFLTVAAGVDPSTATGRGVWLAALLPGVLCAGPWWRYLAELRNRPAPVEAAPEPEVEPEPLKVDPAMQDASDWASIVAVAGGLPGTAIDVASWEPTAGGRQMVIRSKGALTDEKMRAALPLIAAAFDVKRSAIGWVEEFEGSPRSALLLVQPNSPLNERIDWKPIDIIDINNAVGHIGRRIDGSDLITRLWTPEWGAPSRLIIATKGAGKTGLLRLLLLLMLKARVEGADGPVRLMAPFLHDPKRGKDFGAFRRLVCGFSTEPDTLHMIVEALTREMDRRYDMLANVLWKDDKNRDREGETAFDPATMGPVISLIVDEFHEPAKDQPLMGKLDPMGRKMRAAGIEIVAATHLATIGDTGSQGFRDMLAGGETGLGRTTLGLNASLATGGQLVGDPRALPRVAGMNLWAGGEEATMQARWAHVPTEELYDMLYDDDNVPRIQPIVWPQETLDAFGKDFVEWMRACQQPVGSAPAPVPSGFKPAGVDAMSADDVKAAEGLLRILWAATEPLDRAKITAHAGWRWSIKTLSNELKRGRENGTLRKVDGADAFELTPTKRDELQAKQDETAE